MRFIELHEELNDTPIAINPAMIVSVKPSLWYDNGAQKDGARVDIGREVFLVREPYAEVKGLLCGEPAELRESIPDIVEAQKRLYGHLFTQEQA